MQTKSMNIGQLAKLAGVGIDTIRYYEKESVLPKPRRLGPGAGYRRYTEADVAIAALAMSLSSVSVAANALRLSKVTIRYGKT